MYPVDFTKKDFNLISIQQDSQQELLMSQFKVEFHDLRDPRKIYRDLSTSYTHQKTGKIYSWVPSVDSGISGKWRMED
jgi:hypothetical protein